ncbi:MAG: YicC/YloC family endoribonuclease [Pseudomonadota bacterium]
MTKSMTAFARAGADHIAWEVRSVNQRFLEPSFRMPENLRQLEPELRLLLRDRLQRGKIECALKIDAEVLTGTTPEVNTASLHRLARLIDHVASVSAHLAPVNPLEVLRWPGVLQEDLVDFDELAKRVRDAFVAALDSLVAMREREGTLLAGLILERLDLLEAIVAEVRAQAPQMNERLATRIRDKISEVNVEVDAGRMEQELVYLAQKADVQEELDRLDTHIGEIRATLKSSEPVGRRLDFLMQELNREANTLSSKATAAETSIQAVELKVIIEQMREQVQNIE